MFTRAMKLSMAIVFVFVSFVVVVVVVVVVFFLQKLNTSQFISLSVNSLRLLRLEDIFATAIKAT